MTAELTPRQQEVLDFFIDHVRRHHCPPTFAEFVEHFGWSGPNAVSVHMRALERKGFIRRDRGRYELAKHRVLVELAEGSAV